VFDRILPEAYGHFKVAVVSTPETLLVDVEIERGVFRSDVLHLIGLLIVNVMIQLIKHACSYM